MLLKSVILGSYSRGRAKLEQISQSRPHAGLGLSNFQYERPLIFFIGRSPLDSGSQDHGSPAPVRSGTSDRVCT